MKAMGGLMLALALVFAIPGYDAAAGGPCTCPQTGGGAAPSPSPNPSTGNTPGPDMTLDDIDRPITRIDMTPHFDQDKQDLDPFFQSPDDGFSAMPDAYDIKIVDDNGMCYEMRVSPSVFSNMLAQKWDDDFINRAQNDSERALRANILNRQRSLENSGLDARSWQRTINFLASMANAGDFLMDWGTTIGDDLTFEGAHLNDLYSYSKKGTIIIQHNVAQNLFNSNRFEKDVKKTVKDEVKGQFVNALTDKVVPNIPGQKTVKKFTGVSLEKFVKKSIERSRNRVGPPIEQFSDKDSAGRNLKQ